MAPPKKQKREYTAGEFVWVKIKGYPIWPGQVEDVKNVKNDDVIKKKRKNAVLIKFLDDTYTWAVHDDIKPLEKETFEDYIISSNHKTFKQWKDAFEKCCKLAGIEDSVVEAALNSSKDNKNKKKREREDEGKEGDENPKKKKKTKSASPTRRKSSTSPSPKRTARKASLGAEKKKKTTSPSPKKKKETSKSTLKKSTDVKKNNLNPPLQGNTTILREFATLLTQYQKDEETQKVYQLLKVIANFYVTDITVLEDAKIGKIINKLSNSKDDAKIKSLATKIYNYYDSMILESVGKDKKKKEEEKSEEKIDEKVEEKVEEKAEEKAEEKVEEKKEENNEEKKEDTDITITEAPKSEPEAEKTEEKEDDKMITEPTPADNESKPSESQESNSSIIEQSQ